MISNFFNSNEIKVPSSYQEVLLEQFPQAMNIDWINAGGFLEAIFYVDSSEYIAKFDSFGNLENYKVNLLMEAVPDLIKSAAESFGEIMSAICIYTTQYKAFELVIRRPDLLREVLLMDVHGKILEIRKV
jgi:hypothetical protein